MKALILTLGALLISSSSWATIATWSTESGGNGHTYEVVAMGWGIWWDEANRLAQNRGGYLATITSKEENDFIISLIRQPEYWVNLDTQEGWWDGPWIGGIQARGMRRADEGWQWVTGEEFGFTDWHPGQPDDVHSMEQDRLHFWDTGRHLTIRTIQPQWDDVSGFTSQSIRSFVIEYDAVPEPSITMLLVFAAAQGAGIFVISHRGKNHDSPGSVSLGRTPGLSRKTATRVDRARARGRRLPDRDFRDLVPPQAEPSATETPPLRCPTLPGLPSFPCRSKGSPRR